VNYWPYLIIVVLLAGMLLLSQRNRRRQQAAQQSLADRLGVGAEVMTTSGLYGTVTRRNDDGTVQLRIAPGVEVRWAIAALRDAQALPQQYGGGMAAPPPPEEGSAGPS
jgi:preprotein translocase subunit YajC